MSSAYAVHARILRAVHAAEASAMRVDDHALQNALHGTAPSDGDLTAFFGPGETSGNRVGRRCQKRRTDDLRPNRS